MSKKMLAVASSGGHWVQLNRLKPLFDHYDTVYVTTAKVANASKNGRTYYVIDANDSQKLRSFLLLLQMLIIIFRVRPNVVISTGAAPGVFAMALSKLFSAKTIWLDSLANSQKVSLSARLVKRFACVRLTQWEHLADKADGVEYWGKVI